MTDLAAQLRVYADVNDAWQDTGPIGALLREAADELERLRDDLTVQYRHRRIMHAATGGLPPELVAKALRRVVAPRTELQLRLQGFTFGEIEAIRAATFEVPT